TDTTGETRSAQNEVNVAYTALAAELTADDWQTNDQEVKIKISTRTHDGEGQPAKGKLKIYKLQQPTAVHRPSLTAEYQRRRMPTDGKEPKPDPTNPNSWLAGDVVDERDVATEGNGLANVAVKLEAGIYRAMLDTQDHFGKRVTARLQLQVLN